MSYEILYSKEFLKNIKKIDSINQKKIFNFLDKKIKDNSNPQLFGKALLGDKKGLWRYRVNNYRIICEIRNKELIILFLQVGHRKDIYK